METGEHEGVRGATTHGVICVINWLKPNGWSTLLLSRLSGNVQVDEHASIPHQSF